MASDENHNTKLQETEEEQAAREKLVADMLGDEAARSLLIQKLKESGHVGKDTAPTISPLQNPNPGGPWPTFLPQYPFAPFPASPFWGPVFSSPWGDSQQTPDLPWFRMDVGPAWFFMYARPGSGG